MTLFIFFTTLICEIIKTAIENEQNLIIEGCYIPFDWQKNFGKGYLEKIQYVCLVMSRAYIENHFEDIVAKANVIEHRLDDSDLNKDALIAENEYHLMQCMAHNLPYILIDKIYEVG